MSARVHRLRSCERLACTLLLAAIGFVANPASAALCTASVPTLSFGSYDVFATSALVSTTTLSVTCQKLATDPNNLTVGYVVALSTGISLGYAQRQMASGADRIGYNLYTDSARTLIWGDGSGGSNVVTADMRLTNGAPQKTNTHTVYGQVPASQDVAVGLYSDSIVATITY
jgi:spore coat protein U-like protein